MRPQHRSAGRFSQSADARIAAFVARHERSLLRVARQWSLTEDDARDAYQRALEIYVRRIDSLDVATELAWLRVVVKHEALAVRRQHAESVPVDELDFEGHEAERQRPIDDLLAGRERVERGAEALRRLKPDEARALVLKAEGLSYQEIGERLGWTYTKVNRCITEGRARFLKVYAAIEEGGECERFAPTLSALVAGTADADALLELRPHIRNCAACRATIRQLHTTRFGRLVALFPIPALVVPLRWVTGRRDGGSADAAGKQDPSALLPDPTAVVHDIAPGATGIRAAPDATTAATVPDPTSAVVLPDPTTVLPSPAGHGVGTTGGTAPSNAHDGVPADHLTPMDVDRLDELRRLDLPFTDTPEHHGRLLDLKAQLYHWAHRFQGSDVASSAQIAATAGGGGRIATIGAIVGLCLSSVGAGTVCVVSGVLPNPLHRNAEQRSAPKPRPRPKVQRVVKSSPPIRAGRMMVAPSSAGEAKRVPKPRPKPPTPRTRAKPPRTDPTPSAHEAPAPAPAPSNAAPQGGSEFDPTYQPSAPPAPAPAPPGGAGGGEFF